MSLNGLPAAASTRRPEQSRAGLGLRGQGMDPATHDDGHGRSSRRRDLRDQLALDTRKIQGECGYLDFKPDTTLVSHIIMPDHDPGRRR